MPLLALLLIFIVLPIAELYLIYLVGDAIGIWWTLGLLAADSVLGSLLLRSQGRAVWTRFQEAMAAGRMPHREVQDGVAVIFGGAFLITPGFLTDIFGLVLLLPPTRTAGDPAGREARRALHDRPLRGPRARPPARARAPTWRAPPPSTRRPIRRGSNGERPRSRSACSTPNTASTSAPARAPRCCSRAAAPTSATSGPEIEPTRKGWQARLGQDFDVKLEPVADGAALAAT